MPSTIDGLPASERDPGVGLLFRQVQPNRSHSHGGRPGQFVATAATVQPGPQARRS